MAAPADWDAIAALRPALVPHVQATTHRYRGQPWVVLHDLASNRYHRFPAEADRVLSLLDGERPLGEVITLARTALGDRAPDPQQLTDLIAQLHEAELLCLAAAAPPSDLVARLRRRARRLRRGRLLRPLAVKWPLVDPDAWLADTVAWVAPLLTRGGFALWLLAVTGASLAAALHWPELLAHWDARGLDPRTLLLMLAVYPVVKALHELGHAYAVKSRGGEVHEMGVMLLVFVPLPYLDASAANGFPAKRERILVGAAGILVELFLAACALLLWCLMPVGLVGDTAFAVVLTCSFSTLLFNANPLLRFDGYYVLADALEIPNLSTRSMRYLGYLGQRYLLGLTDAPSPVTAHGEPGWFVLYGVGAFVYRIGLTVVIALFVATKAFVLGVLLAGWFLFAQLVIPMTRLWSFLLLNPRLRGRRLRALGLAAFGAGVLAAAALVPVPDSTSAVGVVRLPETGIVRVEVDGFVSRVQVPDGTHVAAGANLIELANPELRTRARLLEHRRAELASRLARALLEDRVTAALARSELERAEARLASANEDIARLDVTSPRAGTFALHAPRGLGGRYLRKGDVIGYVIRPGGATARVVVPQHRAGRVRSQTQEVLFRLPSDPGTTRRASLGPDVPSGTDRLPSGALGSRAGGRIAVDSRDEEGTRALNPVFEFDLALPPAAHPYPVGARIYVRFVHPPEPIVRRWSQGIRRLLLDRYAI